MSQEVQGPEEGSQADLTQLRIEQYSGLLPHPDHLAQFDEVLPGASERIMRMTEQQLNHRQHLERTLLDSQVSQVARGQFLGAWSIFAALTAVVLLALLGEVYIGLGIGGLFGMPHLIAAGRMFFDRSRAKQTTSIESGGDEPQD